MVDAKEDVKIEEVASEEKMKDDDANNADIKSEKMVDANVEVADEKVKNGDANKADDNKPSMLEAKIIRQVEYYFGNINLWRDKFLKEKREEDDGWVTIECLTTFNRLQQLSMDFDVIVNALEKSKTGLLEIHPSRTKIRRSLDKPLPDQDDPILRKTSKMKTLYIKGLPQTYTLDDVQDFILSQECHNVFIKMRLDQDKKFKGSVFVELSTLEQAKKLLNNEIKLEDQVLKIMTREDYFQYKGNKGRSHSNRSGDSGGKENDDEKMEQEPKKLGCVLHFKGASEETAREDLKEVFGNLGEEVEWIDFSIGETQGYVRFKNADSAKKVIEAVKEANDGKIVIKDSEIEARVIEGIEEKNYWILAREERKRPKFQSFRGKKRHSKGQEGWRKRRRPWEHKDKTEKSEENPKNTHIKFEEENKQKDSNETAEKKPKTEVAVET